MEERKRRVCVCWLNAWHGIVNKGEGSQPTLQCLLPVQKNQKAGTVWFPSDSNNKFASEQNFINIEFDEHGFFQEKEIQTAAELAGVDGGNRPP